MNIVIKWQSIIIWIMRGKDLHMVKILDHSRRDMFILKETLLRVYTEVMDMVNKLRGVY